MQTYQSSRGRVRSAVRAGTAPLEFVMVLPFLVILAGMIFTAARASLARSDAILQARQEAWHDRFSGLGGELPVSAPSADKVAALIDGSAFRGLQSGSGSKSARVQKLAGPGQYFFFGSVIGKSHHDVFSNTWDYELIPFRPHAPLLLDSRVWAFTLRAGILAGAADLAQLLAQLMGGIQPPTSAAESWSKVQKALSTISQKLNELDQAIQKAENDVEKLKNDLINETDNAIKEQIQKEIDKLKEHIKKMKTSKEKLKQGQDLAPKPPPGSPP